MANKKKRSGRLFIIIILILIVALALVYYLMTSGTASNSPAAPAATSTPNIELVSIIVASQKIPRGSLITADYLTTIQYPKSQIPEGTFFEKIEDAVGTKAKYEIDPGVPLTTNMVIHENGGSLASFDIPSGLTAFSIAISPETAVAYAPQKGDHVMVVGCMLLVEVDTNFQTILPNQTALTYNAGVASGGATSAATSSMTITSQGSPKGNYELDSSTNQPIYVIPSETQRSRLVCQTIIQDAEILGVGSFPLSDSGTTVTVTPTPAIDSQGNPVTNVVSYPGSVTLIVSPQDAVILNYLELSNTKLSLALRSSGDESTITTDPVTLQYVMDQKNIPSPAKLPYSTEPRVDSLTFPTFNDYVVQP